MVLKANLVSLEPLNCFILYKCTCRPIHTKLNIWKFHFKRWSRFWDIAKNSAQICRPLIEMHNLQRTYYTNCYKHNHISSKFNVSQNAKCTMYWKLLTKWLPNTFHLNMSLKMQASVKYLNNTRHLRILPTLWHWALSSYSDFVIEVVVRKVALSI